MEQNIWSRIKALEGQTLYTTKQRRPFNVVSVGDERISLTIGPSSKKTSIRRDTLEEAFEHSKTKGEVRPTDIRKAKISEARPTYVAAIIHAIRDKGST
jgi:hypothetical protein